MGLCKCSNKKVTNLFCFVHRVNVCEHCMVANHPRCVVQSYLRWLRDNDYSPVCTICNHSLEDENIGECVRLMCYDLYHWACLNQVCQSLPVSTDYTCPAPACKMSIFPPDNAVGPLAEALRSNLTSVNWGRRGMGLPELEVEEEISEPVIQSYSANYDHNYASYPSNESDYGRSTPSQQMVQNSHHFQHNMDSSITSHTPMTSRTDHVVTLSAGQVDHVMRGGDPPPHYQNQDQNSQMLTNGDAKFHPSQRENNYQDHNNMSKKELQKHSDGLHQLHQAGEPQHNNNLGMRNIDSHFRVTSSRPSAESRDVEDKYKRRSTGIQLNNWPKLRRIFLSLSTYKLFILILLLCVLGFVMVDLFVKYGRKMADKEPFLDPMANPNIRVNQQMR